MLLNAIYAGALGGFLSGLIGGIIRVMLASRSDLEVRRLRSPDGPPGSPARKSFGSSAEAASESQDVALLLWTSAAASNITAPQRANGSSPVSDG
jgi:hypothetical protein